MEAKVRLRRDPKVPFQEIEGQAVIVVPARREVHQLDEVGTFLWGCLREERTLEELVAMVCSEFEVSQDRAEKDIHTFIAVLEEKGLVTRS